MREARIPAVLTVCSSGRSAVPDRLRALYLLLKTTNGRRCLMKKDDTFVCGQCGMEITVSKSCDCGDTCATFTCCGQAMQKKEPKKGCCCCG